MDGSTRAPAVFIGHGNPMNALSTNRFTEAWAAVGQASPRPRAVLAISAHWYINATAVTAMSRPRTIHDFYGFPDDLFAVEYPAPGLPALADEVAEVVAPSWVGVDTDSWGLDHGTWSVLVHMYPEADIPVVQLSIDAAKPLEYHLELGARLDALRDRGVMLLGSGNVVHHLGMIDWGRPEGGYDWAHRFDDEARMLMTHDPGEAVRLAEHPDWSLAAPTPEHFLPLLYVAGAAAAAGVTASTIVDGCVMGSLSMISYGVDVPGVAGHDGAGPAAVLPHEPPPDATNA
jgi:4,5-DOPA dioxygenase extradiol